jgi:hypothetical protein
MIKWWKRKKKNVPEQAIGSNQCQIIQPPAPPSLPIQQIIEQQSRLIEELRTDLTELQQRYIVVENDYCARQRDSKGSNGTLTLIAVLCGIALLVVICLFVRSQGGLPDFSNLFTR